MILHIPLLILSVLPWSQGFAVKSEQPQQQQLQQPLDCSKLERLRELHDREKFQARGDKFDDFDWALSKEVNAEERGNIVISPISLKVVLAMLYEGAKGQTAHEIGDALDLANTTTGMRMVTRERFSTILQSLQTSEGEYKIKIGTHVFIDKGAEPKPHYQCKLRLYYNSDMEKVDFSDSAAAVKVINNWARNVTEGHIQDLISEAETQSSTIMLLLNAVYFKGLWEIPFPENQTTLGTFHLDDKQTVKVPLMNVTDRFGYYNISELNAQMIRLPYLGSKFAMYVLLPNSKTGLDGLIKALGPERPLDVYIGNLTLTSINLIMPKFEYDFTTSLRPSLEKLGIKTMFTTNAELSDIAQTRTGSLVVSNVLQKAGISVTEVGTVAYAATVVDLMDKFGGNEDILEVRADHPFLFFIEDESVKTTVFVGKVTNPDKAKVVSTPHVTPVNKPGTGIPANKPGTGVPANKPGTGGPANIPEAGTESGSNVFADRFGEEDATSLARFNFFDADLMKEVGNGVPGNFLISPASIKTVLGMVMESAEGSTLAEIHRLLRLPQNVTQAHKVLSSLQTGLQKTQNSKVIVDSVAKIFVAQGQTLNTSYTKAIKDLYNGEAANVDFSSPDIAAHTINSWVNSQTRGLIPTLIDPAKIDPETMSVLVSAIYFDGKWKEEFQLQNTKEECFYSEPSLQCQKVPMMYKRDELYHKYDTDFNSHILQIPYQDDRFSMVLVVPLKTDGIRQLSIDANRLTLPGLLSKTRLKEVNLKLPRFSMEYSADLTYILTKMGLNEMFSQDAQLPYLVNNKQGRVSSVVHKAKIDVTEKGTKAAAGTGASVVPLMFGLETVNVTADHPFYYFVYEHDSQTVLFSGRLVTADISTDNKEAAEEVVPLDSNINAKPAREHASHSPESSRPNTLPAQNYPYDPASTSTRRYPDQIHFPSTGNGSSNRNYLKYLQQSNRHM